MRVSTVEQNEARQVEALQKHDIERWYIEKISGKNLDRPKLQDAPFRPAISPRSFRRSTR